MEIGIKAREIMREDFPVIDSSLTLEHCMRYMKQEVCLVMHNGFLDSVISHKELLKTFLARKSRDMPIGEFARKNFAVVAPETDMLDVIKIMKRKNIDFIIVKSEKEIGLITKKEIAEINQFLFDKIASGNIASEQEIQEYKMYSA